MMYFKDLPLDQKVIMPALIEKVEEKTTSGGKPYITCRLADGKEKVMANKWNTEKAEFKLHDGDIGNFQIYVKEYNGGRSYEIVKYGPAPSDAAIEDFIVHSEYDPDDMYDEILKAVRDSCYGNRKLSEFVDSIYDDNRSDLLWAGAAKTNHHDYPGGLLEHTREMVLMGKALMDSKVLKGVRWDLLLSGAALHDIGKVRELDTNEIGSVDYTKEGEMLGHIVTGIVMVHDKYYSLPESERPDKKDLEELEHMIASHHGNIEWGAAKVPCTIEAMILHYLDMVSSRANMFYKAVDGAESDTFTEKIFALGTKVYVR